MITSPMKSTQTKNPIPFFTRHRLFLNLQAESELYTFIRRTILDHGDEGERQNKKNQRRAEEETNIE